MTDYGYGGFPPPPFTPPPPPPPQPVTPEELRHHAVVLINELRRLNAILPGIGGAIVELNTRLATLQVDPQASQVNGVVSQLKGLAEAVGLGFDPPPPPKRPAPRRR